MIYFLESSVVNLFETGVDIIFAKKKEMDFMQFLLILAPA